jgi:hypothetical protein
MKSKGPPPEESYQLYCVTLCDPETSEMSRPWLALGCCVSEYIKSKVNVYPRTDLRTQRGEGVSGIISARDDGVWSKPRPGCFTPGKETRYPLYRKLGIIQGRSR